MFMLLLGAVKAGPYSWFSHRGFLSSIMSSPKKSVHG